MQLRTDKSTRTCDSDPIHVTHGLNGAATFIYFIWSSKLKFFKNPFFPRLRSQSKSVLCIVKAKQVIDYSYSCYR